MQSLKLKCSTTMSVKVLCAETITDCHNKKARKTQKIILVFLSRFRYNFFKL